MKRIISTVLAFALAVTANVAEAHDYDIFDHHQSWNNNVNHRAHYTNYNYSGRYLCGHRSLGTYAFGRYRNVCTGRMEYGHYEMYAGHELQDGPASQTFHQYLNKTSTQSNHCEQCRRSPSSSRAIARRRTIGKTGMTVAQLEQRAKLRARVQFLLAKNERALQSLRLAKQRKKLQEQAAKKLAVEEKQKEVLAAERVAETKKNAVSVQSKRLAVSIKMKREATVPTRLVAANFK